MPDRRWRFLAPEPRAPVQPGTVPTFSVVITAFDVAPFLREAVASAFAQTLAPVEVVVVDDGSRDDVDSALAPYRDQITFFRQANEGEASAKNLGARAAAGQFVAFFDGDDVHSPERLEAMGALAAARPDLDILTTNCNIVTDGRVVRTYLTDDYAFGVGDQRSEILERNFLPSPAIRRERLLAIGGFDESLAHGTDVDCEIRLILSGSLAGCVDAPLFSYRQHAGQMTSDQVTAQRERLEMLDRLTRRSDISTGERAVIERAAQRSRLLLARALVRVGAPGARAAAWAIARDCRHTLRTRGKALIAAAIPRREPRP